MKKFVVALAVVIFSCNLGIAGEMSMPASMPVTSSYSSVRIPTGIFWNGKNFIKVESTWVRIVIGGEGSEHGIRNAEIDPSGNYAIVLENGASITIYSDGRSLYYGGSTYSKK